jgi:hypothetical protein
MCVLEKQTIFVRTPLDEELHGRQGAVARRADELDGVIAQPYPQRVGEGRRRCNLDELLMAALHRALALVEVRDCSLCARSAVAVAPHNACSQSWHWHWQSPPHLVRCLNMNSGSALIIAGRERDDKPHLRHGRRQAPGPRCGAGVS